MELDPSKSILVLLVLTGLSQGCGESSKGTQEVSVRDSAGITIVENLSDPAEIPTFAEIDPAPVAEIGVLSGNPDQEFGRVSDASFFSHEHILIADAQARELRLFDFSGDLLWRNGRQGAGPEEFRSFGRVQVTYGDSIRIFDRGNRRIAVLHRDKGVVRTSPFEEIGGRRPTSVAFLPGEWMVVSVSAPTDGARLSPEFTVSRDSVELVITDEQGSELASLGTYLGFESVTRAIQEGGLFRTQHATLPISRFTEWVPIPMGILVGTNDHFQFQVFDRQGLLRRIFRAQGFEEPLSSEMVQAEKEYWVQQGGGEPAAQRQAEDLFSPDFLPSMKPAFRGVTYDPSGLVWVGEYTTRPEMREHWFVFRETGELLGAVDLPKGAIIHDIRGDHILLQPLHELDVPVLRVYRVIRQVLD